MDKLKIEYIDIESIKPYKNNAKLHPQEQIEQIKKSINEFGMDDPIAIWKDEIVEGHGRLIACKQLGIKEIPIIRLDHLTDEERKAYTLVHNKLTMNSDFNLEMLEEELKSIENINMEDFGFDIDLDMNQEEVIIEDEVPEVQEEAKSKPGEIYQLGNHRLMVGDSTNPDDVEKLMDGTVADLVITDPPYNVAIVGGDHKIAPDKRIEAGKLTIENDKMSDEEFQDFLNKSFKNMYNSLKPGGVFYIWYASREHIKFETALNNNNLIMRQQIIWNKNRLICGMQDYQWKHEPCLYGWKEGAGHYFIDDRTQTTVIEDKKPDIKKMKKEEMIKLLEEIEIGKVENNQLRIRKITPKEAWRLMGFDDTDYEKASKVCSNSQLYKQAGNSIVVNVLEAILKNLI